jgi:hypothetical protein
MRENHLEGRAMRNIQEFSKSIVAAGEMGAVRAKRAWSNRTLLLNEDVKVVQMNL